LCDGLRRSNLPPLVTNGVPALDGEEAQFRLVHDVSFVQHRDSASTLGPWLVKADELEPYRDANGFLALDMRVSGQRRRRAATDGRDKRDGPTFTNAAPSLPPRSGAGAGAGAGGGVGRGPGPQASAGVESVHHLKRMNPTSVDAALALVRGIFVRILAVQPSPPPAPDARDHRRRAAQPHAAPGLRPDPDRTRGTSTC
jgi:hypothetical protein